MKKLTAILLCTLMALSAFACSAQTLINDLTEKAEQIGELGENLGESLGGLGENLGESLGEMGSELGENLGELGESIGEGLGGLQIANPFVDYETIEDAIKAAGFAFKIPSQFGNLKPSVQVMDGKMIQVVFCDENGDPQVYIRKQSGDEDISGDYNEYSEVRTETVGDYTVTLKGNDGKISTAIWTAKGYSYAVMFETPVDKDRIVAMIQEMM